MARFFSNGSQSIRCGESVYCFQQVASLLNLAKQASRNAIQPSGQQIPHSSSQLKMRGQSRPVIVKFGAEYHCKNHNSKEI